MARLRILFVSPECAPFAKVGGLADVVGALAPALAESGHEVRVILPRYRSCKAFATAGQLALRARVGTQDLAFGTAQTKLGGATVHFVEHDSLFDRPQIYGDGSSGPDEALRFALLTHGALEIATALRFDPDVVHVHDWPVALLPGILGTAFPRAASVLSIHNLGYQGWFDRASLDALGFGALNHQDAAEHFGGACWLKAGLLLSTCLSTVSPTYAREIATPAFGCGFDGLIRDRSERLVGILNGIDGATWDPAKDPALVSNYTADSLAGKAACKTALQDFVGLPQAPVPLFGSVSRWVNQKGIDLIAAVLPELAAQSAQLVLLGSGEAALASELRAMASQFPQQIRIIEGHDEALARRVIAGSDFFLMPSRYEPCGLTQMYSQRYGTLPVVHGTGGLEDSVAHDETGFKFYGATRDGLLDAIQLALGTYHARPTHLQTMRTQAMQKDMSWTQPAKQYEALYRLALRHHRGG